MGDPASTSRRRDPACHKCLSALGSWGTADSTTNSRSFWPVTNASRHWVHGGQWCWPAKVSIDYGHKCLSALGSWGTPHGCWAAPSKRLGHKCLSALGSWGTGRGIAQPQPQKSQMPLGIGFMGDAGTGRKSHLVSGGHKCLSALGSWGTERISGSRTCGKESQMPLGIGFMGDWRFPHGPCPANPRSQMPLGIGFMGDRCPPA